MSKESPEIGFVFNLSNGALKAVRFERFEDGRAWGIDPNGRASWLAGQYTLGKDLFLTADEARVAADAARLKKLESLRKQLSKLEKMTFAVVAI